MAVYTHITEEMLRDFLAQYNLGDLQSFEGIAQGVSNSNYHVFTDRGRYILTIFEENRTRRDDLPYLFAYAGHLASHGIPCPQAYLDQTRDAVKTLGGKPAALINFLPGKDVPRDQTTAAHCLEMGAFTARMHRAVDDFPLTRESDLGQGVWRASFERMRDAIPDYDADLLGFLEGEIDYLAQHWPSDLPSGAVHTDLFPDNIFFDQGKISAMIDMYFACHDLFAYDLAIVINAWCFDAQRNFDSGKFEALMQGYQQERPLSAAERASLQIMLRGACMRFLLTRLEEYLAYDPETMTMTPHDPQEYVHRLKFHQTHDVAGQYLKVAA